MKGATLLDTTLKPPVAAPQPRALPANASAFALALAKAGAGQANREEEEAPVAQAMLPAITLAQRETSTAVAPVPTGDPLAQAHLARIAAAIAEVHAAGAVAQVHVSFAAGPLPLEGAIIGRDPAGGLAVMLIAVPGIPSAATAHLASDLQQHLVQRQIAAKVRCQRGLLPRSARSNS